MIGNNSGVDLEKLSLRPAWGHMRPDRANPYDDDMLQFVKQLGVDDVLVNIHDKIRGEDGLSYRNLVLLRNQIEDSGLRLNAIEQLSNPEYDKIILGLEGRDERIDFWKRSIRRLGRAGIPILGFHWAANGVWRTSQTHQLRGGAKTSAYNHGEFDDMELTHDREFSEEEIWENYEYFIKEVVPVAEEAGVKLALHPNDPPVEGIGGIPFIFRDFDSFDRGINEIHPSPNLGLKLCFGCWSEMKDVDALEAIRHFGEKIFYVHFRDVESWDDGLSFNETFIDGGNYDMYEVIKTFNEAGATPALTPDHIPRLNGDTTAQHRGYAYTLGFMKGIIHSANSEANITTQSQS